MRTFVITTKENESLLTVVNYISDRFRIGKNIKIDQSEKSLTFRCNPEVIRLIKKSVQRKFNVKIYEKGNRKNTVLRRCYAK